MQTKVFFMYDLFGKIIPKFITTQTITKEIGVSEATVRNWIKANYIHEIEKGKISEESYQNFCKNILGKEKLNKRANKLFKDSHNEQEIIEKYLLKIKDTHENIHILVDKYQNELSNSYRNKEGIYYTPNDVVSDLFQEEKVENKTFCDPCCGGGNFIMKAIDLGFQPQNIFGFDTDPVAVELTKQRIFERTGYLSQNIICGDFLELLEKNKLQKFDVIYTNPPWGKKVNKIYKKCISKLFSIQNNADTSTLFFLACLKILNDNGNLGLLLPDSFFNVGNYTISREIALRYKIYCLKGYGKVFKGLQTGAVGLVLQKQKSTKDDLIKCEFQNEISFRKNESFSQNPKLIFNISCNEQDVEVIEKIFSISHKTLKNNAIWGLGIVTGNNNKFVKKKGKIPIYKGSDITKKGLRTPTNFIDSDFSEFQQIAPMEFFKAEEKLIYRFISSNLCFYFDTQQNFVLNSANFLIVRKDFAISMKTLCDLLNSDFMNWLFKKLFATHKVLRSDLEVLPIHTDFLKDGFEEEKYLRNLGIKKDKNGTYRIKR